MPTISPAVNHWKDPRTARAFWGQQELPAYRRLLDDTIYWAHPEPGERWLDLGCGSGPLTRALWQAGSGMLEEIVSVDCAAVNEEAIEKVCTGLYPPPGERIRFVPCDFSGGLADWESERFEGVLSGLAIQYAESFSPEEGRWTTEAYDHLLTEVHRVLAPGGRFVFSVNVPEPSWGKVGLFSFLGAFQSRKPLRFLKRAWRMMRYGAWLKQEARTGRFHYLPWETIAEKLAATGFSEIEHCLTYAGQAYLFRCRKSS